VQWSGVGVEKKTVAPDGTITVSISGHRPVEFNGTLKINAETEEVIHESHAVSQIPRMCQLLTG
jgi:hypothetical protein